MKKVHLTLVTLVVASSCYLREDVAKEKAIDEGFCPIEYDYLDGLFKLKNPADGKVAEMIIEVQRAGQKLPRARTVHVATGRMEELDLTDGDYVDIAEDELQQQQEELERLTAELAESEADRDKLQADIAGLDIEGLKRHSLGAYYSAAEKQAMDRLRNSVLHDLVKDAAEIVARAKDTGIQLTKLTREVQSAGGEMDARINDLYDAIDAIGAKHAELENVEVAMHNALVQMDIARHGLPDRAVVGRTKNGDLVSIYLKQPQDGSHDRWDIWGATIRMKASGSVFRYDPLKPTDGGERLVLRDGLRDKYLSDRPDCAYESGSEMPTPTPPMGK